MDRISLHIACYPLRKAEHFHPTMRPDTSGLCPAEAGTASHCLSSREELGVPLHPFLCPARNKPLQVSNRSAR